MDTPALDATKFIGLALRSIVVCTFIIVISTMTMIKLAFASGTIPPTILLPAYSNLTRLPAYNGLFVGQNGDAQICGVDPTIDGVGIKCANYFTLAASYYGGHPTYTYTGHMPGAANYPGSQVGMENLFFSLTYSPETTPAFTNLNYAQVLTLRTCPANSDPTPPNCTCKDSYVPDLTQTSCILGQYTLTLKTEPLENIEPSKQVATIVKVVDAQGNGKGGVTVSIKADVDAGSGGHDHDSGRHVSPYTGTLDATTGITRADGTVSFNFTAPEVSGTHTFTAKCISPTCTKEATSKIDVKVDGLIPIPSEPSLYALIGGESDKKHHDNHYLTDNAMSQLTVLAINYHFLYPNEPVLHLNDASLEWGGKFDIKGNWVGDHKMHRRGVVIDIRANTAVGNIPERLFTDFEDMAAKTKLADGVTSAKAKLHCSSGRDPSVDNCVGDDNRHYHVILLGVDQ